MTGALNIKFLGLIEFSHLFTEEDFDNQYELFIAYILSVRKMKEVLLKNFLSIAKESTTFSMNTGPDFGVSCWTCTRSAASDSLWEITLIRLSKAKPSQPGK